jgi:hypothetical protein
MRVLHGPLAGTDDEGRRTGVSPLSRRGWLHCSADGRPRSTSITGKDNRARAEIPQTTEHT